MEMNEAVFEQYKAMQRAGVANMANMNAIQRGAMERGHDELVAFIDANGTEGYYDILLNYGDYDKQFGGN